MFWQKVDIGLEVTFIRNKYNLRQQNLVERSLSAAKSKYLFTLITY